MRKIKGLRIPIRYYEIERKLRKDNRTLYSSFGEKYEEGLKGFISSVVLPINISVCYDIFELSKVDFLRVFFIQRRNISYVSVSCMTFGDDVYRSILNMPENERQISNIIIDVHFKTGLDSIIDMINEEVKKDKITLLEPVFIYKAGDKINDRNIVEGIEKVLDFKTIGVSFNTDMFLPFYTWFFSVPLALSKK